MARKRGNGEGTIYRRGSDGRWFGAVLVGYDASGKPVRKTVSAKTRTEVVAKLRVLQQRIDDGLELPDLALSVEHLIERWGTDILAHQVASSAAKSYLSVARNHILPTLGKRKVVELTTAEVDRLVSSKVREGLSTSTVQRIRSVLAQALDQAMRWGIVGRNVATLARAPKAERREGRTLTPDQARDFLAAIRGHRLEALLTLMLATGLRRGEALGLLWTDFDRVTGTIRVQRQLQRTDDGLVLISPKTARSRRTVNLPPTVTRVLIEHEDEQRRMRKEMGRSWIETGHIFTTSFGTPLDPRNALRDFKKICKEIGLGDWHLHELRHSAASLMLAQGAKIQVVSEVLGHSSIRMTADVYGHILDPDRQAAASAMESVLWSK